MQDPNPRNKILTFLFASAILIVSAPCWSTSAADYRRLADAAVKAGQFALAADYFRQEAAVYDKLGDHNAATVEHVKSQEYASQVDLYAEVKPNAAMLEANYTGAKFEPFYGCYLGAFVDNDPGLDPTDAHIGEVARAVEFGKRVGKLACAWEYCRYGQDFPFAWAHNLIKLGITPHLALEPDRLADIHDDDYLHGFAKDAKMCGGPIFLRFAGEMNGDWTSYHDDPQTYIAKFRLVHDVFAQEAPNVAMIWCVNALPETNWDSYYPGDAYVDWVGVNFYSVIHHDNDSARPAWLEHPTTMLDNFYSKYGARKPIAICEYGSSHQENLDSDKDYSDVAAEKISSLFAALPRKYPRVKMIDIFDSDNLSAKYIQPGRQLNNYCVTDTPVMLDAMRRAVASWYFLPRVESNGPVVPPAQYQQVPRESILSGPVRLSLFSQCYDPKAAVTITLDGNPLSQDMTPGDHAVTISTDNLGYGKHVVKINVADSTGHIAASRQVSFLYARQDEVADEGSIVPGASQTATAMP